MNEVPGCVVSKSHPEWTVREAWVREGQAKAAMMRAEPMILLMK
jgi:hypothetical protein